MLLKGTSVGLEESALKVSAPTEVSSSPTVKKIGPTAVPVSVNLSGRAEIVGGSLTMLTVKRKSRLALNWPSLTVKVTVALPLRFAPGVTLIVRFPPLPPRIIFWAGTKVGFEQLLVILRLSAETSASAMVK